MTRYVMSAPLPVPEGTATRPHLVECDDCGRTIGVLCESDLPTTWTARLIGPTQQVMHFCPLCDAPDHHRVTIARYLRRQARRVVRHSPGAARAARG